MAKETFEQRVITEVFDRIKTGMAYQKACDDTIRAVSTLLDNVSIIRDMVANRISQINEAYEENSDRNTVTIKMCPFNPNTIGFSSLPTDVQTAITNRNTNIPYVVIRRMVKSVKKVNRFDDVEQTLIVIDVNLSDADEYIAVLEFLLKSISMDNGVKLVNCVVAPAEEIPVETTVTAVAAAVAVVTTDMEETAAVTPEQPHSDISLPEMHATSRFVSIDEDDDDDDDD